MMKIAILILLTTLTSCTFSVVMNHTEGTASDMVDTQQEVRPDVKVKIPLIGK
jgi:hypothetical protein